MHVVWSIAIAAASIVLVAVVAGADPAADSTGVRKFSYRRREQETTAVPTPAPLPTANPSSYQPVHVPSTPLPTSLENDVIITQETVWTAADNPLVEIKGNLLVKSKLIIQEGVRVIFGSTESRIVNDGDLRVLGTESNRVVLEAAQQSWLGIFFTENAMGANTVAEDEIMLPEYRDLSILRHVDIVRVRDGLDCSFGPVPYLEDVRFIERQVSTSWLIYVSFSGSSIRRGSFVAKQVKNIESINTWDTDRIYIWGNWLPDVPRGRAWFVESQDVGLSGSNLESVEIRGCRLTNASIDFSDGANVTLLDSHLINGLVTIKGAAQIVVVANDVSGQVEGSAMEAFDLYSDGHTLVFENNTLHDWTASTRPERINWSAVTLGFVPSSQGRGLYFKGNTFRNIDAATVVSISFPSSLNDTDISYNTFEGDIKVYPFGNPGMAITVVSWPDPSTGVTCTLRRNLFRGALVNSGTVYLGRYLNPRDSGSPPFIDASYSYWGTTDPTVIEDRIFDGRDAPPRTIFLYEPFLREPSFDGPVSSPTTSPPVAPSRRPTTPPVTTKPPDSRPPVTTPTTSTRPPVTRSPVTMPVEAPTAKPSCRITVLLTNDDKPDDKFVSADGKTCLKVESSGNLIVYNVDSSRALTGGGSKGNCQGDKLFESKCLCDNNRRRLTGGDDNCAKDYVARVQGDGQFKVEPVDGGKRIWKTNRHCNDGRRLEDSPSASCFDDELYAVVRNGCDGDKIQVWEWRCNGTMCPEFVEMIWTQEMDSERCYV